MKMKNPNLINTLGTACNWIENLIAIILVLAVLITLGGFLYESFIHPGTLFHPGIYPFIDFLSGSLKIVIGIEFVHMLLQHRPDTLIDILMFATARKIITDQDISMFAYGIGILAVAVLYLLRHGSILKGLWPPIHKPAQPDDPASR